MRSLVAFIVALQGLAFAWPPTIKATGVVYAQDGTVCKIWISQTENEASIVMDAEKSVHVACGVDYYLQHYGLDTDGMVSKSYRQDMALFCFFNQCLVTGYNSFFSLAPSEILLLNDKGVSQNTFLLWRVLTIWTEPLFQIWRYGVFILFFTLFFFLWILAKKLNRQKYLARVFLCGVFGFAFALLSLVAVWSWGLLLWPMLMTILLGFVIAKRIVRAHFQNRLSAL